MGVGDEAPLKFEAEQGRGEFVDRDLEMPCQLVRVGCPALKGAQDPLLERVVRGCRHPGRLFGCSGLGRRAFSWPRPRIRRRADLEDLCGRLDQGGAVADQLVAASRE